MGMSEINYGAALPIAGYGADFFRLGEHILRGACLITPWEAGPWGGLDDIEGLLGLRDRIDVLLLGLGKDVAHPPAALREALEGIGIGVEPMSTPAACRTYNVLLSEGRRIAVALLPVG